MLAKPRPNKRGNGGRRSWQRECIERVAPGNNQAFTFKQMLSIAQEEQEDVNKIAGNA
jgi:hypothetical protein